MSDPRVNAQDDGEFRGYVIAKLEAIQESSEETMRRVGIQNGRVRKLEDAVHDLPQIRKLAHEHEEKLDQVASDRRVILSWLRVGATVLSLIASSPWWLGWILRAFGIELPV